MSAPPTPPRSPRSARWAFFREWLKSPRRTSSVSPSSPQLARHMIAELPERTRRVIELGGGTGVFTRALLAWGIEPGQLLVVELNTTLSALLERDFPGVEIAQGNAAELEALVASSRFGLDGPADAVFSGLGLLAMSQSVQREILAASFGCLGPEGCFIQFTYGHTNPVSPQVLTELGLHVRRGATTWRNLPPATVFVYTRSRSVHVVPRSMAG